MILISACLCGVNCRHDGCIIENEKLQKLVSQRKALPLCPEVLGGRSVPREPAEIVGGSADDVINGFAKVMDITGKDVTDETITGVLYVVATVKKLGIKTAILKTKSPTCGMGKIFDGSFSGKLIDGNGILTAALLKEGIDVYTEDNCAELVKKLLNEE
ncbi:MAG: DUF523 domain-containing protein [Candidatus Goldbacteria bacterium]|nr:DUF523 domain-containing protein [Candidatus Goldiibacteriota bacterium]